MNKKSQAAIELILVIGIIILIFLSIILIYNSKKTELNELEIQLAKNRECSKISNLISLMQSSRGGISINTSTQNKITINSSGLISVSSGTKEAICTTSGNIISNIGLENTTFNITNTGNQIVIEET